MPVTTGSGVGQYNLTINHVSNGDPANQTVFRAPSINLENRTDALKTFADAQEALRNAQVGASAQAIGGLQGNFNTTHRHTGSDGSSLIDLQQVYNNDDDNANFSLATDGSYTIKRTAAQGTPPEELILFAIDNNTEEVYVKTWADAVIDDNAMNWGTDENQINLDCVPDGTVNAKLTAAKQAAYDAHLAADASAVHSLKYQARPYQPNNVLAQGSSVDVTEELSTDTPGGSPTEEGIVTEEYNLAIIKVAGSFEDLTDNYGNKVYGRITHDGTAWTLSFYSNVSGTETAYSFTTSQSIAWWVQKVYTLSNIPVFDSAFQISSDEVAGLRRQRQANLMINGSMDIPGGGSTSTSGTTVLKRWTATWAGFSAIDFSHTIATSGSDLPDVTLAGYRSKAAYQLTTPSAIPTLTSTAVARLRYALRGQDLMNVGNGQATITFWVKASQAGTYSLCLKNRVMDRAYVTTYTVNTPNAYERKSIIVDMTGLDAGSWDFTGTDSDEGLFIDFVVAAGVDQAVLDAQLNTWIDSAVDSKCCYTLQTNLTSLALQKFTLAQVAMRRGVDPNAMYERPVPYELEALIA